MTLEVGGRKAELTHINNAHTDGDTWVYFEDANVHRHRRRDEQQQALPEVDFANGGDIRGMIRATDAWLKLANDQTKVVTGHGPLANKADIATYNAMVKTARERVEKLFNEGKTEAEVVAVNPLADLNKTWAANEQAASTSSSRSTTRSSVPDYVGWVTTHFRVVAHRPFSQCASLAPALGRSASSAARTFSSSLSAAPSTFG